MKIVGIVILLLGVVLGSNPCDTVTLKPEKENSATAAITGAGARTTAVTEELCKESCKDALDKCSPTQQNLGVAGEDATAVKKTADDLVECVEKQLHVGCSIGLPITTTTVKRKWYKSAWFITLMTLLGVLAVLGAIYHLMGHPGLSHAHGIEGRDERTGDTITPEEAERLM